MMTTSVPSLLLSFLLLCLDVLCLPPPLPVLVEVVLSVEVELDTSVMLAAAKVLLTAVAVTFAATDVALTPPEVALLAVVDAVPNLLF